MDFINAIEELDEMITNTQHTPNDILWIGSQDGKLAMSYTDFKHEFSDVNYDAGFGGQEIASDLVVVFSDHSWLEREEYDGAENWVYRKEPQLVTMQPYQTIKADIGWQTLAELN